MKREGGKRGEEKRREKNRMKEGREEKRRGGDAVTGFQERGTGGAGGIDDFTMSEMTFTAYLLTVNARNLSLYSLHVKGHSPPNEVASGLLFCSIQVQRSPIMAVHTCNQLNLVSISLSLYGRTH